MSTFFKIKLWLTFTIQIYQVHFRSLDVNSLGWPGIAIGVNSYLVGWVEGEMEASSPVEYNKLKQSTPKPNMRESSRED